MSTELAKVIEKSGLEASKAELMMQNFSAFFKAAKEWESKAMAIRVTDVSQVREMKDARTARLALKELRVSAEKARKQLKEQSLREGKAIDGIAAAISSVIVPIEEHLEDQEKFAERKEAEEKQRKLQSRRDRIAEYVADPSVYNLKEMSDDGFDVFLARHKQAHDDHRESLRKREAEKIEREKAEREEKQRLADENRRLESERKQREQEFEKERSEMRKQAQERQAELDKVLEAQRKEREDRERQEREKQERADEESRRKQLQEQEAKDAQNKSEYLKFLASHGWTEAVADQFKIDIGGASIILYKKLGEFKIIE